MTRPDLVDVLAPAWAVEDISTLCARATKVSGTALLASPDDCGLGFYACSGDGGGGGDCVSLPKAMDWDLLDGDLDDGRLDALLRQPGLRRVVAERLDMQEDWSGRTCKWETLTLRVLEDLSHLLMLPSGVGQVVVTEQLQCPPPGDEELMMQLFRWGPSRLRLQLDQPPDEFAASGWRLGGEAQHKSFFVLDVRDGVRGNARLLQRTVLPPGGGPHTLELLLRDASALREMAQLLVGTQVRTLCMDPDVSDGFRGWGGVLAAVPPSVSCVRLQVGTMERVRELLLGKAARHAFTLVLLLSEKLSAGKERWLRDACASRQPLVKLEVV